MPADGLTRLNKNEGIEKAIALVRKAKTYRQIANELGVSLGTAHNWVQEGLRAIPKVEATALRQEQAERLEYLHEKLMEQLESPRTVMAFDENGEPIKIQVFDDMEKTIDTARKLSESFRKLHGLDAPQQVQGQVSVDYKINGINPETLR